ncbi:TonB-dependent receptor, partial [bacterium]|nr:TonB-dependent receptor [bacterium]
YRRTSSIHGGTVRSNTYAFDGVNMNDPVVMYPLTNINFDVMEEVEMITAGLPASVGYTTGAYVNIVTRSGGNNFSGGGVLYYTNDSLAENLWTDEDVEALGVSQPTVDKSWVDFSFTLGGPIVKDKLWFFTNGRTIQQTQFVNFVPFTDILGRTHEKYDWEHQETMGFFKLTSQLTKNIKVMGMFNLVDRYRPMYEQPSASRPFISTRIWDHEKDYTGNFVINYIMSQNTFFDIRAGYVHRYFPIPMQEEARGLPYISDYADNYGSLTTARFNETYLRTRAQGGLYFTHFQDNFLGGNHEFKGGVEFEDSYGDWDWWRQNNLYQFWYGGPYYFGEPWGLIAFSTCGPEKGSSKIKDEGNRIGAYIQDSATFGERLTLNLGLRFDRSWGSKPAVSKDASGNDLSIWVGENVVRPYVASNYPDRFPDGINPFGELSVDAWENLITWNSFSPRIGLTFDVFGDGRTALKASFSRYTEYLMLQYFSVVHPMYPNYVYFYWYDSDRDGQVEKTDGIYDAGWEDYRAFDLEFAKKGLDPDTSAPLTDEITVGIQHELVRNFSVGLDFIYKNWLNIVEDSRYALDTGEYWYHMDQAAAQEYYVPFNTTVPSDEYGEKDVTIYVRKEDAPPIFYRLQNPEELERKYWALEFTFRKRMSNGWQFNGSVVYSKAYGQIGGWYGESWGWSGASDSPNWYVNRSGRLSVDRPLQIKLMGTVELPYRVFLSGYFRYFSGSPYARNASIEPPSDWCEQHNAVQEFYGVRLEPLGTFRQRSRNSLDLRLEKEFRIGDFGTLGAYIDAINLLGYTDLNVGKDDVYRWYPDAEGYGEEGEVVIDPDYKHIFSIEGLRVIKASIRFSF